MSENATCVNCGKDLGVKNNNQNFVMYCTRPECDKAFNEALRFTTGKQKKSHK